MKIITAKYVIAEHTLLGKGERVMGLGQSRRVARRTARRTSRRNQ